MKPARRRVVFGAVHYAWIIVAITFFVTLTGAGIRSTPAVFIQPLELEFGWNRALISSAIAINLFLYGVAAPLTGRVLDRYGPRPVMIASMALVALGVGAASFMTSFWQMVLLWGIVVGLGSGGVATVLAASVANRWFVARRGFALGLLNSASSTGQLIFIPLMMGVVVTSGWRIGSVVMCVAALVALVIVLLWMRNEPADVGTTPYGVSQEQGETAGTGKGTAGGKAVAAVDSRPLPTMRAVLSHPTFWLLAGSYFICGATTNGLVGTHLIPHSLDRGIPEVTAAITVGVMGGMNFVGTTLSGWLTDKVDARRLLSWVFLLRALSLFILPFVGSLPGLVIFAIIYGLDWFATVPPVITLTADTFGRRSVSSVYGWIFLSHQAGSSMAAFGAGAMRVWFGDYQPAFLLGGALAVIAALLVMNIRRTAVPAVPAAVPAFSK